MHNNFFHDRSKRPRYLNKKIKNINNIIDLYIDLGTRFLENGDKERI